MSQRNNVFYLKFKKKIFGKNSTLPLFTGKKFSWTVGNWFNNIKESNSMETSAVDSSSTTPTPTEPTSTTNSETVTKKTTKRETTPRKKGGSGGGDSGGGNENETKTKQTGYLIVALVCGSVGIIAAVGLIVTSYFKHVKEMKQMELAGNGITTIPTFPSTYSAQQSYVPMKSSIFGADDSTKNVQETTSQASVSKVAEVNTSCIAEYDKATVLSSGQSCRVGNERLYFQWYANSVWTQSSCPAGPEEETFNTSDKSSFSWDSVAKHFDTSQKACQQVIVKVVKGRLDLKDTPFLNN